MCGEKTEDDSITPGDEIEPDSIGFAINPQSCILSFGAAPPHIAGSLWR
jgi:hypothetical protein